MNEYISTKSMKSSLIIKKKKNHEKKPTTHLNHKMTKINISIWQITMVKVLEIKRDSAMFKSNWMTEELQR